MGAETGSHKKLREAANPFGNGQFVNRDGVR